MYARRLDLRPRPGGLESADQCDPVLPGSVFIPAGEVTMSSSLEEPKTVRAPERQDAGGPVSGPEPASGGTYSQGAKAGGEAGTIPSGTINAKNLTRPVVVF